MNLENRTKLLGIDPSFVTMGAALYDPSSKRLDLGSGDFQSVVDWIGKNCLLSGVIAIVENPALDKTVFGMWGVMQKAIIADKQRKFGEQTDSPESVFARCMMYAQKVGENKAAAKMIIQMLDKMKVPIIEVAPSERQKGFKKKRSGEIVKLNPQMLKRPTKLDATQFKLLTGYSGQSNEHSRDAATLIWGYTMPWARATIQVNEQSNGKKPGSFPSSKNNNYSLFNHNS